MASFDPHSRGAGAETRSRGEAGDGGVRSPRSQQRLAAPAAAAAPRSTSRSPRASSEHLRLRRPRLGARARRRRSRRSQVLDGDRVLAEVPPNEVRPDVAGAYPDATGAESSGFQVLVRGDRARTRASALEVVAQARATAPRSGSRRMRGRAQPLAVARTPELQPGDADHDRAQRLEVAGLAAQLPPLGASAFQPLVFEPRVATYWTTVFRALTRAEELPAPDPHRALGRAALVARRRRRGPAGAGRSRHGASGSAPRRSRSSPRSARSGSRPSTSRSRAARRQAAGALLRREVPARPGAARPHRGDLPRRPRGDPRPRLPRPAQLGLRLEREARRPRLRARAPR